MIPAQHMTQNSVIQCTRKELTQTLSKERAENKPDFQERSKNEGSLFTQMEWKKKPCSFFHRTENKL